MTSKRSDFTLNFGTPPGSTRTSSEFEEVGYPHSNADSSSPENTHSWTTVSRREEDLPLHYMNEDAARRRVVRPQGGSGSYDDHLAPSQTKYEGGYRELDDGGKDVYTKMKATRGLGGGRVRRPHAPPPTTIGEFIQQNLEHIPPVIYTLLSCWTRFHAIGKSNLVVWDEAHFGKFGTHYLKREFYFDVHPPLGKMLVGLAGLLSGYDGSFDFKSGEKYPEQVPYVAMRVLMATFGVAMVPLGWYTAVELGMSWRACHLVALMILLDVGWLCISRFILLDSMLLFFTLTTVFFLSKFHNQQYQPFSFDWWTWLVLTGLSIGSVTSIKLIGLFVTALVGLYTIEDLWEKFGDVKMSWRDQAKHWAARIGCLIVLPILVYMATFKMHFLILNHSGPGDAQMSSLFQANLVGNDFANNPLEIAFGSRVTLKNVGYGGGLLHSHVQTYPVGSSQQQITCYHYKDANNDWNILPNWNEAPYNPETPMRYLKDAPVTKANHEVSCYGNDTVGDAQDHWTVEVVDDLKRGRKENVKRIHSLTTRMRFRHNQLGCYLRAGNVVLPQWGFKQIEVTCDKENNPKDVHTYWNVESHWNERLPPGQTKFYRSPFLGDFWHLNVAMWTSNNALIPDPDKEDILASKPWDWPLLTVGLRMCGWSDTQTKYYLMGTPIIWWGSTASLFLSVTALGVYLMRQQRKIVDMEPREWDHFLYVGKVAFLGWFLHFAPFLIMGRVTYIHHYLPTLYFAVLMFAHMIDHFIFSSRRLNERTKWIAFGVITGLLVASFWWFKGVAFGIDGPINDHWGLHWRKSWNIYNE
ncbi:Protein O-mannosyltransferase 2 [Steccherinum ochraceum]|uniref:Dolichyl-phosphate-mannose--protein mannosyltransferase n=1 Tax=Steccherinum ochraceum TaxID=92696 RepID=A0A4R0RUJ9_9APHY|nr:Protein O-mannosyltransferase 2 [Steccherinum ochraceum]